MAWKDRDCMQKFLLIVSIFAVLIAIACFAANMTTTVKASQQKWFRSCDKCADTSDPVECNKYCCQEKAASCSTKGAAFFYILRIYTMLFCIMCVLGEVTAFKWYFEYFKIFRFYWGRGMLHIFVGFLTVNGDVSPDNEDAAKAAEILGWIIMASGILHIFLSLLCFKEYSKEKQDEMLSENYTVSRGGNPSGI